MSFWTFLKERLRPARITDRQDLRRFLESRAAYLVQKSIMEYCQARANMLFSTLLSEKGFLDAYDHARWHSYPAAFSMVAEALEGTLRPASGDDAARLRSQLAMIGAEVFSGFPLPAGADPLFWSRASAWVERDLGAAGLAPPKPVHRIPAARAREIFDVLPVHADLRTHDFEMFRNTLKLHLTEIHAEFEESVDLGVLARELAHGAPDKH